MLVQGARLTLPPSYQWRGVDVAGVSPEIVRELPQGWRDDIALTRRLGDAWLARRRTALLEVPSVIVPRASNYLLNPAHPDAARCGVRETVDYPLDPRLLS